jgi:glycosyltransferase involved in cell wall biosynthesis
LTLALALSEHDLADWGRRYAAGEVPSRLPYGIDVLEQSGISITGARVPTGRSWQKLRDVVDHRAGFPVARAVLGARTAWRADLVLALLERQGMLPGLWRRTTLPPYGRRPLVIWSCWLADDLRTADAEGRRRLARRVAAADLVTHLSRHETDILVDAGLRPEQLFAVTYGVSHRYYTPGDMPRDLDVLAVGQDRGRDYATLLDAVRGTDLTLDVVCKPENLAGLDVPPNVRVHGPVPLPAYRALLRRAKVVAVPTRTLAYPTGSSVALEAASSGAAVVVTGTPSMADYFRDGVNARLLPEGAVEGWRAVLVELRDDPGQVDRLGRGARANVVDRFNADVMWTELASQLRERGIIPTAGGGS